MDITYLLPSVLTEAASGSAVKRELLPNGSSGEKMMHRVKMSDVTNYSRCLASSKILPRQLRLCYCKNVNSLLDAVRCAKTRSTVRNFSSEC